MHLQRIISSEFQFRTCDGFCNFFLHFLAQQAAAFSQEALKTHRTLLLHKTKQQTHTVIEQPLTSVEHLAAKARYFPQELVENKNRAN